MAWTPPDPPTQLACPFCGAVLVAGVASCPRCGSSVGGAPPQFAAPAPPYPLGPPQPLVGPASERPDAVLRPVQDDRSLYNDYLAAYTSPSRRGIRAIAGAVALVAVLGVAAIGYGLTRPDPRATGLGTPAISGSAFASEFPSPGAGGFPSGFPAPSATAEAPVSAAPPALVGVPYHSATGHFTARFPNTPTPVSLAESVGTTSYKLNGAVDPSSSTEVIEYDMPPHTMTGHDDALLAAFMTGFDDNGPCTVNGTTDTTFEKSVAVEGDCTAPDGSQLTVLAFLHQDQRLYVVLAPNGPDFDLVSDSFALT
jgi:hypothetical protein